MSVTGHFFSNSAANLAAFMSRWVTGNLQFLTLWNDSGRVYFYVSDGTNTGIIYHRNVGNLTWHSFACVFDGSLSGTDRMKVYVDGDADDQVEPGASVIPSTVNSSSQALEIGSYNNGGTVLMNGNLDSLALWDIALTQAQVTQLHDGTVKQFADLPEDF